MTIKRSPVNIRNLAIGSVLSTVGGMGALMPVILPANYLQGPVAFSIGFLIGVTMSIGVAMCLLNLRPA